jgi:ADP-ribose pyrophosphatase
MTEKTISTESLYNGKILNLRRDTAELCNGNHAAREVVEHSGGVCVVPLTESGNIVMVRQFRYPFGEELLEIPAGKLERGENPLRAAERELFEETGYRDAKLEFLGKLYPTPAYCTEVIHMYLARGLKCNTNSGSPENHLDEDEFLEVVTLPFNEVIDMIIMNEISDAKTQLAVLKTRFLLDAEQEPPCP